MFGYRNTFIYDADGRPVQHLQYLPFGQSFVNQHTTGYQERYTFTGKEKDGKTARSLCLFAGGSMCRLVQII